MDYNKFQFDNKESFIDYLSSNKIGTTNPFNSLYVNKKGELKNAGVIRCCIEKLKGITKLGTDRTNKDLVQDHIVKLLKANNKCLEIDDFKKGHIIARLAERAGLNLDEPTKWPNNELTNYITSLARTLYQEKPEVSTEGTQKSKIVTLEELDDSSSESEEEIVKSPEEKEAFEAYKKKIIAKYGIDENGQLITKDGYKMGLTKEQMETILDTAEKQFQKKSIYKETRDDIKIFGQKPHKGTMKLFYEIKKPELLGAGNWGLVKSVVNITKATQAALKTAYGREVDYLEQEYKLLKIEEFEGLGIQARPSKLFSVYSDFSDNAHMMGKRYEGSLLAKSSGENKEERLPLKLELKEGLRCAYQTLTGLERGHHKVGIIFGDRKPDNVLIERGKRYDLADLGGSIQSSEIDEIFRRGIMPVSMDSRYVFLKDIEAMRTASWDKDAKTTVNYLQKMDVLGNGITLWEVFTGKNFPREEGRYPGKKDITAFANLESLEIIRTELDNLVNVPASDGQRLSPGMRDVILSMLNPDIDKRWNSQEALANFKHQLDLDYSNFGIEFKKQEEEEIARVAQSQAKRHANQAS